MLTAEQISQRFQGIGGSDAAAVCGVSKFRTPLQVFLEKTRQKTFLDETKKHIFERGHTLEPLIGALFKEHAGIDYEPINETKKHPEHNFMIANVDGYVPSSKRLLEIKHINKFNAHQWGDIFSDQIPNDYLIQVNHYLNVFDLEKAYVAVLFGDTSFLDILASVVKHLGVDYVAKNIDLHEVDFRIYTVERNKNLSKSVIETEKCFWYDHVEKNIQPTCTSLDDLRLLFPQAQAGKVIQATHEIVLLRDRLKQIDEHVAPLEDEKERIKITLQEKIGDAECVEIFNEKPIKWSNVTSSRLETRRFKEEHPDLYKNYVVISQTRRLTY